MDREHSLCTWLLLFFSRLCNPLDCSPSGSSVHGISQARVLKWVAIPFFRGSFWPRNWTHVSCTDRCILYHWATWETLLEPSLSFIRIKVWKLVGLPGGSVLKESCMQEMWVWSLGWEDPLEKEMAVHCSILAWGIPWTEKPSRPQSMGSQRVGHNLAAKQQQQYTVKQTRKPVSGAACIQQMCDRGSGVDQQGKGEAVPLMLLE